MSKLNKKVRDHFENNCDRLVAYLKKNKKKGITTMEAMLIKELSMTNIPRRILDLKELGYEFIDIWECRDDDSSVRWKRWFLIGTPKRKRNEKSNRNNRPAKVDKKKRI